MCFRIGTNIQNKPNYGTNKEEYISERREWCGEQTIHFEKIYGQNLYHFVSRYEPNCTDRGTEPM